MRWRYQELVPGSDSAHYAGTGSVSESIADPHSATATNSNSDSGTATKPKSAPSTAS